jgi:hypothetical protein
MAHNLLTKTLVDINLLFDWISVSTTSKDCLALINKHGVFMKSVLTVFMILVAQTSFAAQGENNVVSESKKFTTLELSNRLLNVSECYGIRDPGFAFWTYDFSFSRKIVNKVWLNDQAGNAIPDSMSVVEKVITTRFSDINNCVGGIRLCGKDESAVKSNCDSARAQYLEHLKANNL